MIAKMIRRAAAAFLSLYFALFVCGLPASASGDTCTMFIPATVSDGGGKLPAGTEFTLQLAAVDSGPLPAKTSYEVTVSGTVRFGPIVFDEPGDYEYTIREIASTDKRVISDKTVYKVHATVLYDDTGKLVCGFSLTKDKENTKPDEVRFVNYTEIDPADDSGTDPPDSSQTDPSSVPDSSSQREESSSQGEHPSVNPFTGAVLGVGIPLIMLPLLIILAIARRRSEKDETTYTGDGPPNEKGSG